MNMKGKRMTKRELNKFRNSDWLTLPVLIAGSYPLDIMKQAKKIASSPDEVMTIAKDIAEARGVTDERFTKRAFPYDKLDSLLFIQEDPDNSQHSDLIFADGDSYIINVPYQMTLEMIHDFLSKEPKYRNPLPPATALPVYTVGHLPDEDF